jgi:hypothetical protein
VRCMSMVSPLAGGRVGPDADERSICKTNANRAGQGLKAPALHDPSQHGGAATFVQALFRQEVGAATRARCARARPPESSSSLSAFSSRRVWQNAQVLRNFVNGVLHPVGQRKTGATARSADRLTPRREGPISGVGRRTGSERAGGVSGGTPIPQDPAEYPPGAGHGGPAPGLKKLHCEAPAGVADPVTTMVQRGIRLYPGGRVVLVPANSSTQQSSAKLLIARRLSGRAYM